MNYLLIGKPNVGKSSIFNILTSKNFNIVHPDAGTTRDWHKELIDGSSSYIFDTPGVLIDDSNKNKLINYTFDNSLSTIIDSFIYVIQYSDGFNLNDKFNINLLRKYNKKIILLINKFDNYKKKPSDDFNKYGLDKIIFISCAHSYGINELKLILDVNTDKNVNLSKEDFSLAIFGKPNAGKSSFLNSLVGYKRSLTSPIAGTTSDYVVEYFNYKGKNIKIIDTAGIGKKSNVRSKSIDFLAIKKSFENIKRVDTSLIIIDAYDGIDRQDKRIIKLISHNSKSVILIFNKIDLIEDKSSFKSDTILDIDATLSEVKNLKAFFISALKKPDVAKILLYIFNNIFTNEFKISTGKLNTWLKSVVNENQHPLIENKRVNFKYAVQVKTSPVTIKIFCSYSGKLRDNYKKFLINNFNRHFKILNQKTHIIFSSSKNPYV